MRLAQLLGLALAFTAGVTVTGSARAAALLPYQDPSLPVATRVADLLARMSLDEKLGQMTQAERGAVSTGDITQFRIGSILSGGGSAPAPTTPPAGPTCTTASRTPRSPRRSASRSSTASTRCTATTTSSARRSSRTTSASARPANPPWCSSIGRAVAEEVTGTGVDWDFAPCLCVARNDRWGRTYESFGEKPEIPSR